MPLIAFHYFGGLLWEAFRRGQRLGNRVNFDDFSLPSGGYFRKPSVRDSCLVTGLLLMTFYYFGGLLWEAFRRGQLLSNRVVLMTFHYFRRLLWEACRRGQLLGTQVTFDDVLLLREVPLGSSLSGSAA